MKNVQSRLIYEKGRGYRGLIYPNQKHISPTDFFSPQDPPCIVKVLVANWVFDATLVTAKGVCNHFRAKRLID